MYIFISCGDLGRKFNKDDFANTLDKTNIVIDTVNIQKPIETKYYFVIGSFSNYSNAYNSLNSNQTIKKIGVYYRVIIDSTKFEGNVKVKLRALTFQYKRTIIVLTNEI